MAELHGFGRRITVANVHRDFENDNSFFKPEPYSYEVGYWNKGLFEGYGQRLSEMEVQEGIWKGRKLITPKEKVPEENKQKMEFDYKYFVDAKGLPEPERTKVPRPEDHPLY